MLRQRNAAPPVLSVPVRRAIPLQLALPLCTSYVPGYLPLELMTTAARYRRSATLPSGELYATLFNLMVAITERVMNSPHASVDVNIREELTLMSALVPSRLIMEMEHSVLENILVSVVDVRVARLCLGRVGVGMVVPNTS